MFYILRKYVFVSIHLAKRALTINDDLIDYHSEYETISPFSNFVIQCKKHLL